MELFQIRAKWYVQAALVMLVAQRRCVSVPTNLSFYLRAIARGFCELCQRTLSKYHRPAYFGQVGTEQLPFVIDCT